uniref:Uncharacterized protein n=1 Tax=Rhipicephalus microplus TaxID=6941 RepID=A0A6G5AHQ5_RHIMP
MLMCRQRFVAHTLQQSLHACVVQDQACLKETMVLLRSFTGVASLPIAHIVALTLTQPSQCCGNVAPTTHATGGRKGNSTKGKECFKCECRHISLIVPDGHRFSCFIWCCDVQ